MKVTRVFDRLMKPVPVPKRIIARRRWKRSNLWVASTDGFDLAVAETPRAARIQGFRFLRELNGLPTLDRELTILARRSTLEDL